MARAKVVYVSEEAHDQLKVLAARRKRPMGRVVEELVASEIAELANPWLAPEGLLVQQRALAEVWADPALDVYNDD
jgi:predicted DNA-binding protein